MGNDKLKHLLKGNSFNQLIVLKGEFETQEIVEVNLLHPQENHFLLVLPGATKM